MARARRAPSIRPSWPPPRMPIVDGRRDRRRSRTRAADRRARIQAGLRVRVLRPSTGPPSVIPRLSAAYSRRSAGSLRSASRKAMSRGEVAAVRAGRGGGSGTWCRPARASRPASAGVGGHGSGPGLRPEAEVVQHRDDAGTSSGVGLDRRGRRCPCRAGPGTAVLPMCSTTRSGRRSRDELRRRSPRRRGLVGPRARPWRAVGRTARSRSGSRPECRLRPHATDHRPTVPRGGRRLSHRPDRPV